MTTRFLSFVAFLITVVALVNLAFISDARAHDKHGTTIINNHNYPAPQVDTNGSGDSSIVEVYSGMDSEEFDNGMAMSAAGDTCVFDYAQGWQGCFGGGWYGSASAINGSLVTRVDNFAMRVNIQSDTDFDEQAIGVGGSWHF
jgi:hypothetical protein